MAEEQKLPFEGIRIIEITTAWAGPRVARMMADMGAEVIKIENPARPDNARRDQPFAEGETGVNRSGCFEMYNRGKKDVTLDLKSPEGVEAVKRLGKISDAVVINYAPRVMDSLGLGYDVLKEIKPDIIMVSLSGYGATGPARGQVAFGAVLEAYCGLDLLIGYPGGPPRQCGTVISDHISATTAHFALLAALHHRNRTGEGQHLDISELETLTACMPEAVMEYTMNGRVAQAYGNRDEVMVPHGTYRCKGDDKWVAIAVDGEDEWRSLCRVMGKPQLAEDERFSDRFSRWQHQDELDKIIGEWTSGQEHVEIMKKLQAAGVAAGPVYTLEELYNDPHIEAREILVEFDHPEAGKRALPGVFARFSETPGKVRGRAPLLGEHTDWLLNELLPSAETRD